MPIDFYSLPVYQNKNEILKALEENQTVIIESPTGSGKTTQLPLILREAGYDRKGVIGITQPRRIATLSICEFIKKQISDEGSYCGYKMRFADTTTQDTRIKIMTDGILLQEVKADPVLSKYSVIMVDEAHERSLNIDFILGLLKEITQKRSDLKIVVSSATINTKVFSSFFDDAPIISIDARTYPVELVYKPLILSRDTEDMYYEAIDAIIQEDKKSNPGDVLVFLSGEADIKALVQVLQRSVNSENYEIYPLYGRLSKEEQERVFTPTEKGKTKVVVATNIAETSITIDGITTVIDSGLCKINFYNQRNFTSALVQMPISASSADQRKGRAGRTREGVCYRLYTKENYAARPRFTEEEILHSDLAEVVLRMSELGIYNYDSFPFITPPKRSALESAVETLKLIGAINGDHTLTSIGEMMIKFPLVPRLSRVIVEAIMNYPSVLDEVLIAVSTLSTRQPYVLPMGEEDKAREAHKSFQSPKYGDFIAMRTLFGAYSSLETHKEKEAFARQYYLDVQTLDEIVNIHYQLSMQISEDGIPLTSGGSIDEYFCCLISGLRQYVARKDDMYSYKTITASSIFIHPGSAWFKVLPEYILAGEIVQTTKMYARTVSPVSRKWLDAVDPKLAKLLDKGGLRDDQIPKKGGKNRHVDSDETGKGGKKKKKASKGANEDAARSELDSLELYNDNGKKKGKKCYLATLEQIRNLRTRDGGVKIYIRIGAYHSRVPVRASRIDYEIRLIRNSAVLSKKPVSGKLDPEKDQDLLEKAFDLIFVPFAGGRNVFDFLGLSISMPEGRISLIPYPNITDAVDETVTALYYILDKTGKKSKIRKSVYRLLDRIEEVWDSDGDYS